MASQEKCRAIASVACRKQLTVGLEIVMENSVKVLPARLPLALSVASNVGIVFADKLAQIVLGTTFLSLAEIAKMPSPLWTTEKGTHKIHELD